jgi:hypothetical protein
MSTTFPTTIDSYSVLVDNVDNVVAAHPNDRADAVVALETKVGVTSSAVTTSHDYLLTHLPAQVANWDAGSFKVTAQTFESDVATGTAPLIVASTTVVTNLNADTVDGKHVAGTNGAGEITTNDGTQTLTSKTLTSPTINSPTLVTPTLGVATATTINKVTITQPANGSTLTIQDGYTLTANGNATVSGTNTGDQTNITGNAATVTTNANLSGVITSVGNTTSIGSQTGTGTNFVVDTSPTIITPTIASNIKGMPHHLRFTIIDPATVYGKDTQVCLVPKLDAAITITNLEVTCDAAANEVLGDLKYADTFIGLANATVINDFDTTSGVRSDSSITSGAVASGKAIYIQFDSVPNTAVTQISFDITFDYD